MSTQAQILANQANSLHSSGPKTEEGKAISSKNNFRHGLTGPFVVLSWENREQYQTLERELLEEHKPITPTEQLIVEQMAQSCWLRKRALTLQHMCFHLDRPIADQPKDLALYLRYQTTHDRAFYKALNELQKLRAEKRKQEIGFVSQERKAAEETRRNRNDQRKQAHENRRDAEENRRQQLHQARVWLTEAQARRHDTETAIAELVKMPRSSQSNPSSGQLNDDSRVATAA